jgi:hypothetical protein
MGMLWMLPAGTAAEMVCPGGEEAFVMRMVRDSLQLRGRVHWYAPRRCHCCAVLHVLTAPVLHSLICAARAACTGARCWLLCAECVRGRPQARGSDRAPWGVPSDIQLLCRVACGAVVC